MVLYRTAAHRRHSQNGQSLVEFVLVVPIVLVLLLAIADFGRIYTSLVAVESAAREAADFGAFKADYWLDDGVIDNRSITVAEMERRACTSAAGSHLAGYEEPTGTIGHATCTNPAFSYALEPDDPTCWEATTLPPCTVHVTLTYRFDTILGIPPLPSSVTFQRDSRFRITDLQLPPPPP
jgi:Flp pilus assembly protein TadG